MFKPLGLFSILIIQINIYRGVIMKEFIRKILAMFQPAQLPPPAQYVELKQPEPVKQEAKSEQSKKYRRPKRKQEDKSGVVANPKPKQTSKEKTQTRRKSKNKPAIK